MSTALPIAAIRVVNRHRTDMGDLAKLAESIGRLGLLHPLVVNPDGVLVAGGRRLEAVRHLGWTEVAVTVAANLSDAQAALEAERDENACREDMKPSEFVALGLALEELERPRAEARHAERSREGGLMAGRGRPNRGGVIDNTPNDRPRRTHDEVAKALGVGGSTYLRARAVVQASEDESLPDDVRALAQAAREEMDSTGKVNPAYSKVATAIGRRPTAVVSNEQRAAPYRAETDRQKQFAKAAKDRLVTALSGISGYCRGIETIDLRKAVAACTDEELATWAKIAGECARELRKLRSNLNGSVSDE